MSDPRDMDQLASEQEQYVQEIKRVISNYKKDSIERKSTTSYYEERLRRLEAAWSLFDKIDEEIRSLPSPPLNHQYFTSDCYGNICQLYEEYKQYFSDKIIQLKQKTVTQLNEEGSSNQLANLISGNDSSLRKSKTSENTTTGNSVQQRTAKGAIPKHSNMASISSAIGVSESSIQHPPNIVRVLRRQGAIIQSLHRLFSSLESAVTIHQSRSFYELKLNSIQRYWSQIEDYNNTIWELIDDPTTVDYDIQGYIQLEELVQKYLIQLSTKIEEQARPLPYPEPLPAASPTVLKLPKITLPKFDGDYTKWRQFFDLFSQMVHNQPMSNCQKMWYLKTNLVGEAEKLVRHFTLSEENYTAAWKMLQDRYENPRLLVAALINKLLNQPSHATETPSAGSIKAMHDITQECLLGLENLGVSTSNWDPLLLHILLKKLDRSTHALYEQSLSNPKGLQSLKQFLSFLETRFQSLEALGSKGKPSEHSHKGYGMTKSSALASVVTSTIKCIICKENHPLFRCQKFLKMTPNTRLNIVRKHDLCVNCLRKGHNSSNCTLRGCTKCKAKHNTLVHLEPTSRTEDKSRLSTCHTEQTPGSNSTLATNITSNEQPLTLATSSNPTQNGYVLLSTARVKIVNDSGKEIECRAILDSGSQVNLISERAVKKLGVTTTQASMCIQGIGQGKQQAQKRINVQLKSRINEFSTRLEAFVLTHIISPQPRQQLNTSSWAIPHNIQLADPTFDRPDHIDILLGAEFYLQLLSIGQIKLGPELPTLQNTILGWIVAGKLSNTASSTTTCGICTEDLNIERALEKFWEIEEAEETRGTTFTLPEKQCEALFNQTVKRMEGGRFVVRLPFAENTQTLGESKDVALRRFMALERKLGKNEDLRQQYIAFMAEYLQLGHMEEVDGRIMPLPHYFLPHHSVLKPDSSTTKLRVVFDASAKTSTNLSLNDLLHTGPTIQDDLFTILLRFRLPRFVFTADIEKMYRQIIIHEEDRKYQLIWWRSDPNQSLKCYQLNTVTYGTSSAPYLATKCLQRLALDEATNYPIGAEIVQRDFYVDDVMTGDNSLIMARHMQKQLIAILAKAGFKLRKWCANHPQLLQDIPPQDQEIQLDFTDEKNSSIKTLGLTWMPKVDQFQIKINQTSETKVTKRIVASEIARLFDPLGIMGPVTVTAKIFLQRLWELKLDWDASLPAELHTRWIDFRRKLPALNDVQFQRHMFAQDTPKSMQFHAFSDASEKAYGAAIYIRSINNEGRIIVRLLCAKSRVAPTKRVTLPRLELCAAKLAAELLDRVKHCLKLKEMPSYLWTDSEIVLAWINSTSRSFQTFVGNRISAIQGISLTKQWRHVKTNENPADLLSRGVSPENLKTCNLWFYGPLFLHGNENIWPPPYTRKSECNVERKQSALTVSTLTVEDQQSHFIDVINHKNSFRKLQRIVGYVLRFIAQARRKNKESTSTPTLTAQELDEALFIIIKRIQENEFKEDIRHLSRYKELHKTSALATLAPFLDDMGILRVGGRTQASNLPYDARHQMLLPHKHELTKLLMTAYHKENYHIGPQGLLSSVRQRFWPIQGKSIARSIVQHCIRCARSKPKLLSQLMGNLPATRVQPARPFVNAGVDFCGPLWIHYKIRGKRPQKSYIAVFCCFSTKAVHLEVVSDLSTEAFVGALRRFIGRRGHCRNLYCDNATNFVGAKNQLTELCDSIYSNAGQQMITSNCSQKGIDFHFIPPRAPHFGGLWEAAVKSAKHLLVRTISSASLTYEELETVIVEIEAILNSRPLTPLSSDPNDINALTPGHFLIGEPLTAQIDSNAEPMRASLLTRWKLVSHCKQEFWKRWSSEYLHELQYRFKWKHQSSNAKPGMLVVIKEDNIPVMKWPLGRILEVYKGEDGCVRVADVRTATGVFRRPIHRLAPLPCEEELTQHQECQKTDTEDTPNTKQSSKTLKRPLRDQDTLETSTQNSKKKTKGTLGSSLLTVLLTCLLLPITRGDFVEVTQFNPQLGLHFENLGSSLLITSHWEMIVYYDLHPYWMELGALRNGTKALQKLCDQFTFKSACRHILSQFEHLQDELSFGNELLTSSSSTVSRNKRGAINIIGNVANALFGILDQEYAEEMSKTISSINDNQEHLMKLLRNQTSIVDSTINIIKKDQAATEKKFNSLDDQITQIINHLHRISEESQLIHQQFMSLAIQMTLITTNLQHIQSTVNNVITDIHHGQLNPLLLSPHQLQGETTVIRNHLPSSLKLPMDSDNVVGLYRLMNVKGRITKNHVIFQIKIPLVNWEKFDLLRVLPIPLWINNSFIAIEPHSPFLIVAPHRDRYYPITELELLSCIVIKGGNHLCNQLHPIYHRGASTCACEMDFLNNAPKIGNCQLTQGMNQPIWIRLSNANHWLFSVSSNTSINVVCDDQAFSKTLYGSGILKIQPQCSIKEKFISINGHQVYTTDTKVSYTMLGISLDNLTIANLSTITRNDNTYQPQLDTLRNLHERISSLDLSNLPTKAHANTVHHLTISYLALLAVIFIGIYLTCKFGRDFFTCCSTKPQPKPRPRQTINRVVSA